MSWSRLLPLVIVTVVACDSDDPMALEVELDPDVAQFVSLLNVHRVDVGCPALEWNAGVATVAQAHSEDMAARGFFSHTNPDGKSPFNRLADAGVGYSSAAENIAYGYSTAAAVMSGWLGSSGHRANIENCGLTQHGVGLHEARWTHVFIRP